MCFGGTFLTFLYEHQDGWETIADHTETLVMFGGVNPKNAQVSMGGITRTRDRGLVRQVRRTGHAPHQHRPAEDRCARRLRVDCRAGPASDTALMLALAHVIETEGLTDHDFLTRCTVGFDRFRPYLMGEDGWPPKIAGMGRAALRGRSGRDPRRLRGAWRPPAR